MADMKHGGNVWEDGSPSKWLDFSANLRPEGVPEWLKSVMVSAITDARYYPDCSMKDAIKGLSEYTGCPEECVLPTPGGAAAIDAVLSDSSGRVLLRTPTFGEYAQRAAVYGRAIQNDDSRYEKGDTLVICNPNNPTGEVMCPNNLLSLSDKLSSAGAELMVDEAFCDYCPEFSVRRHTGNGLTVVGSLTKILCVPGIRLGYICSSPERIARLKQKQLPWSLNAFAAAAAANLYLHIDEINEYRRINDLRREQMRASLENMGIYVYESRASFLLCRFSMDIYPLAEYLKRRNILVRTCASFGLNEKHMRLAVKTEDENNILLSHIKDWLNNV